MSEKILQIFPPEGVKIVLTLFLCFLIGLEREEHRAEARPGLRYSFGGVRAFPLIGLLGYSMALLSGEQLLPLTVGFAVIGSFLWLSYRHKLQSYKETGVTTELSGLATYVIGALVSRDQFWIATTLAILAMLLLELKEFLENLATKIPGEEIFTFTKFLLLTCVILPIVPDEDFTSFALNPYKTWLVVVAISGVSYGSYLLEKLAKGKGGIRLAAVLGGAYSSTFTTFVMAKRAREANNPHCYSGGILMASGVMYFRFLVLIGLFNAELFHRLLLPFLVLGAIGIAGGWMWSTIPDASAAKTEDAYLTQNPLELASAFLLAVVFAAFLVATRFALVHLGSEGIYGMAAITGLAPVDPFIMGLTQTAGKLTPVGLAAGGVVVAAASNNFAKAFIARILGDSATGRQSFALLLGLTALGLLPLLWIVR
ncbi:MAG TPA: MgtC/SapB family protein [Candidatus Acidoferrales bacterium]|nr:MgtC/SapB family protein [Candidatus Acidoferrales bacterium]